MVSTFKLFAKEGNVFDNPSLYKSIVGAMQHITLTRPDISYSINKVNQFMSNYLDIHWIATKMILKYLAGTLDFWDAVSQVFEALYQWIFLC